jgi:hypothetical protein
MAAPAGVARVAEVYVLWKHCVEGSVLDMLTAAVAGGPHVHCELCFRCSAARSGQDWSLLTVGAIWPLGVYASDALTDPFYGVTPAALPGQPAPPRWTWLNVTQWFPLEPQRLELWQWSVEKVGVCGYGARSAAGFCLPGGGGVAYGAAVADKPRYICSELVADGLFRNAAAPGHHLHDPAICGLAFRCREGLFAAGGTSKLSPQALYEFLSEEGRCAEFANTDLGRCVARGALQPWQRAQEQVTANRVD